jgi:hypothetical protein
MVAVVVPLFVPDPDLLEGVRRTVVGGWDADVEMFEDDLTPVDRLAVALERAELRYIPVLRALAEEVDA